MTGLARRTHSAPAVLAAALVALSPALVRGGSVENALLARLEDASVLSSTIEQLTDGIGPRLTGSVSLLAAHRYAATRFGVMGLEVAAESFPISHTWSRGAASGELVSPYRLELQLAQLGWSPPTPGEVQGPVMVFAPKTKKDMATFSGHLSGRIVLAGSPATELEPLLMVPPLRVDPKGAVPREKEKTEGPSAKEQHDFLRAEGALAVIRDAGKPEGLLDMKGDSRALEGPEGLPAAVVIHEQYLLLTRLAAGGAVVRLSLEGRRGGPAMCVNTIASLPGAELPEEFVVVGAHLDSWDLGTGATDNAAGSAAVIEAARLLAEVGARPRRTIRFVLFSGEEQGFLGSKAYIERHREELPRHSAMFVLDTGAGRVDALALQGRADVEATMRDVLSPAVPLGVVDTDLRYDYDTDHVPFDAAGVPAFCFEQVQHEYSRVHHSEADTLDKVMPGELQQAAVVLALTAYRTAQLPDLLPRGR